MKVICAPNAHELSVADETLYVELFGTAPSSAMGACGQSVRRQIAKRRLAPVPAAWDFLSLALGVIACDLAGHRDKSPDGWTRDFELAVAVSQPDLWSGLRDTIEVALAFLTTDRWRVSFLPGGFVSPTPKDPVYPKEECIVLLSGGLDSLVGAIDIAQRLKPLAVSQVVRGDLKNQARFAQCIAGGIQHLPMNHNVVVPKPEEPPSQRARSIGFLAFGVLAASALARYHDGDKVPLFMSENGFISINPPLTGARIGSLSTRTTHPVFLTLIQRLLDAVGILADVENPYRLKTKGEMLSECHDQSLLQALASESTSCGRFKRFGYRHCGRCVPCQIRRAAFLASGIPDRTSYVFENLGQKDGEHAGFDDVRSAAMAIRELASEGAERWLGCSLSRNWLGNADDLRSVVVRGLDELRALHEHYGVE